jgi:hypothetical protein
MSLSDINIFAVILAAIVNNVISALWYSKAFFGSRWAHAHRFDINSLKPTPWHFAGSFAVSFVIALVLSGMVHSYGILGIRPGLTVAFFVWLGFIVTTQFSGVIWARKPLEAYLIDIGGSLVSLMVMMFILVAWQ